MKSSASVKIGLVMFLVMLFSACSAAPAASEDSSAVIVSSAPAVSVVRSEPPPVSSEAESQAEADDKDRYYKAYEVDPDSFELAAPQAAKIPVVSNYGEGTVADDLAQCEAMLGYTAGNIQPYCESAYFEYGHRFSHRAEYVGAYQITTLDGTFDDAIAHRFEVAMLKDGQPTGETGRYYVVPKIDLEHKFLHLLSYFYDEGTDTLRYVQMGQSFSSLYGVERHITGAGMMQPEGALEDADYALAAYVAFLGGSADMDTLSVCYHSYVIPPSTSDEDWYSLYFFVEDRGEEKKSLGLWGQDIVDGLVYRNEADPTLWQVYDDQAKSYLALRLENGRFTAAAG